MQNKRQLSISIKMCVSYAWSLHPNRISLNLDLNIKFVLQNTYNIGRLCTRHYTGSALLHSYSNFVCITTTKISSFSRKIDNENPSYPNYPSSHTMCVYKIVQFKMQINTIGLHSSQLGNLCSFIDLNSNKFQGLQPITLCVLEIAHF